MKRLFSSFIALLVVALSPVAWAAPACCRAPAGTLVRVELADAVSTKVQKTGDTFAVRLAAPLIVGGKLVLRAGTPGVGEVIESSAPGLGGKAAKLVLAVRYLERGSQQVRLEGLQMAAMGRGNQNAANIIGISGIVLGPIGFVGMAVQGGNVVFPAGTTATAKLASSTFLPALGPASRQQIAKARADLLADRAGIVAGPIPIGPPPRGQGQVVFFRPKSLLGTGQWFNVRENGVALGKLTNGAYFVQPTTPGMHTYTASSEPEFKDKLILQIDPGETYFVEGILTHGVVIGAAALSPSDQATFVKTSARLKPAEVAQTATQEGSSAPTC